MAPSRSSVLQSAKDLWRLADQQPLDVSACRTLLQQLANSISSTPPHKTEVVSKTFTKLQKAIRVEKRKSDSTEWSDLLKTIDKLLKTLASIRHNTSAEESSADDPSSAGGAKGQLPSSVHMYLTRLKSQKKDLYKNPPVLPPPVVTVESQWVTTPPPRRDRHTGTLTFAVGQDTSLQPLLEEFHPNRTPQEILQGGAFGGTYFRSIVSAVTNQRYNAQDVLKDTLPDDWIHGLDTKTVLTSQTYHSHVNKYKAKCGGSLGMWESSGWISNVDPYGWFQWYCRFYQGRRCSDDARQIARWKGVSGRKGRFRSQLCNKILAAGTRANDTSISPVIRQTLWHWGLEITDSILAQHRRRLK